MLRVIFTIFLLRCSSATNGSLSDSGQTLYLDLGEHFKGQPAVSNIEVDIDNSLPYPINLYLNITLPDIMNQVTKVTTTTPDGWQLSSARIIKGISIFSQPARILLVQANYLVLLALEESGQTRLNRAISLLNITEVLGPTINCTDVTVNPNSYSVYVKCDEPTGEFAWIVRVQLLTQDQTDTIQSLVYDKRVRVSLAGCKQRQLLYSSNVSISGQKLVESLLMLCPALKRQDTNVSPLLSIKGSLDSKTYLKHNFGNCPKQCCNSTEVLSITKNQTLIMITNKAVFSYNADGCSAKPLMTIKDFRQIKIGTATWVDDLYVLTRDTLIIKYPKLNNLQSINIIQPRMDVTGFVVTKHYIYLQYKSLQTKESLLRVYTLNDSIPYLAYKGYYNYSHSIYEIDNYLSDIDAFFNFDLDSNTLDIRYYRGRYVTIQSLVNRSSLNSSHLAVTLKSSFASMTIDVQLRSFADKRYSVDLNKLSFKFEEQYITVPLQLPFTGPLLDFYLYENRLSTFDYINGLNLVDLVATFPNQETLSNIIAFKFKVNINEYYLEFFSRSTANGNAVLDYHTCSLEYQHDFRQYSIGNCISPIDIKFTSKTIKQAKHFTVVPPRTGSTDLVQYLINDDRSFMLCDQTGQCANKDFSNLTTSIDEVKVVGDELVIMLVNNRKVLRLYTLRSDPNSVESILMEVGSGKLKELNDPNISIVDFKTDSGFKEMLVVMLSNSVIYIVQRSSGERNLLYLCHITSMLTTSQRCTAFGGVHLFRVSKVYRLVVICHEQNAIVEYIMTNPFSIRYSRRYPLYDYTIRGCHFSDSAYLYVQVIREDKLYYLVYDPADISGNMPSKKIEVFEMCPRIVSGYTQGSRPDMQRGLGLIGDVFFTYSGIQFVSKVESNVSESKFTMGVRNDVGQNSLVDYTIGVDLTDSFIFSTQILPEVNFDSLEPQNVTVKLLPEYLRGPIQSYQLHSNCTAQVSIDRLEPLQKYECLARFGEFGRLVTFISLEEGIEVVVTTQYLLCIQRHRVQKKWKRTCQNCSLQEFHHTDTQVELLLLCEGEKLSRLTVDMGCQIVEQAVTVELQDYVYFEFRAGYPYLTLEVPILLPENRDYYSCVFNPQSMKFVNCSALVNSVGTELQESFRSIDFDMDNEYVVLLERGIGVFEMRGSNSTNSSLNASVWIAESDLAEQLGIYPPFSYIRMEQSKLGEWLIFEVATTMESYEVHLDLATNRLTMQHIYNKYVNCYYNRESKPQRSKQFIIKSCEFRPSEKFVVSNLVPIVADKPSRLLQVFLKLGNESWPGLMMPLPYSGRVFFNNGFMIVSEPTSLICYDKISEQLAWHISYQPASQTPEKVPNCTAWITLKNSYITKEFNFTLGFISSRPKQSVWAAWLFRSLTLVSGMLLLFVMQVSKKVKIRHQKKLKRITRGHAITCVTRDDFDQKLVAIKQRRLKA